MYTHTNTMKFRIALLLVSLITIMGCKKTTNVEVSYSTVGTLDYKLLDDSGKGLPGQKVSLYNRTQLVDGLSLSGQNLIMTTVSDQNGVAKFEGIEADRYLVVADSVKASNVMYNAREYVQVVGGVNKVKETKVNSFAGNLVITMRSRRDYSTLLPNMGVSAFPTRLSSNLEINLLKATLDAAPIRGSTDANGVVTLKLPAGLPYYLCVYTQDKGVITFIDQTYIVNRDQNYPVQLVSYGNTLGTL